jgi:MFS family permease
MIKNRSIITATSFLSMFFLGVAASLIGAAARNIGLTPYQIGLMITIQNVGFMIAVLISGAMSDTYEKPKILFIGSLILGIAFATFYLSKDFTLNLFIMLSIGIGIGTYEGVTDAMLLDIHKKREGLFININHFFVTFGSIIITTYLIFLQMDWRKSVTQSAFLVLILALIFAFTRLEVKSAKSETYLARLNFLTHEKLIVAIFLATAIVVGIEAGTIGILTTYLMDLRGFTQITSKIGLVLFLIGMAGGRILFGYIIPKARISTFVLALFGACIFVYGALYLIDFGTFTYAVIFLAGIAMSALLPLMLTLVGLVYKDMAGTALGAIKVAIPLGGILIPLLMSMLANAFGFKASLLLFPMAFLVGFLILYYQFRMLSSVERIVA